MTVADDTLFQDLQLACILVFERHGISAVNVMMKWLLSPEQVRNARIRQEYYDRAPEKREALFWELEQKYGLTRSAVEKIVGKNR